MDGGFRLFLLQKLHNRFDETLLADSLQPGLATLQTEAIIESI